MTFAVAGQVIGDVITSSPGPTPSASSARCIAAVPELTASTCSASRYAAQRSSSSAARGPVVSQPERSVSATAATSSSPIAGGWKPSGVLRRVRIDPEAYGVRRTAPPLERVVAVGPRDEHGAGAVGSAPQRPEDVTRAAVDAHPLDARQRLRLRDAFDLDEAPDRRHEEDDRRPCRTRADWRRRCLVRQRRGAQTPSAKDTARALRSTPVAAAHSSASWPPPSRAATSITTGPAGPRRSWV